VITEITFFGPARPFVISDGVIGADVDTESAARARPDIQDNQAVISPGDCFNRANLSAGRIIAVAAAVDPVNEVELPLHHLRSVFGNNNIFHSIRSPIFLFTGYLTGFATPTGTIVNKECIFLLHRSPHRVKGTPP
jgi:hypothetical protein